MYSRFSLILFVGLLLSSQIQAQIVRGDILSQDPESLTIELDTGRADSKAFHIFPDRNAYEAFLSMPIVDVTQMTDDNLGKMVAMPARYRIPKDQLVVTLEKTVQERNELTKISLVDRKYLGTLYIDDPKDPLEEEITFDQRSKNIFVFEGASGELVFWSELGFEFNIETNYLRPGVVQALKDDLVANRADPSKANYRMNNSGDIVDTGSKENKIILKADPASFKMATNWFGIYQPGVEFIYNAPHERQMTAEEYISYLKQTCDEEGCVEVLQQGQKTGFTEMIRIVDNDESNTTAPANEDESIDVRGSNK